MRACRGACGRNHVKVYVANKIKDCEQVGIKSIHCHLQEHTEKAELIKNVEKSTTIKLTALLCNCLCQHLNENEILSHISIHKDVDGLSAYQMGKLTLGIPELTPCTPSGVMEMLRYYEIPTEGKRAVIIGRSNIVGKPMAMMLMKENATVTVCHSRTKDLAEICSKGDILVAAVGKARFVNSDMVKEGAVVIDVGINRVDGKLCGDVDFDNVADKCSYITPVPGGVGLMTRAMLLLNTLKAYELYA